MKKRKVNALLAIVLSLTMMVGVAGCGKKQQLEEILKGKKESLRFVKLCFEEDPMIRSMGALMSFQTLRRVDNELKDEDISRFLRLLNENT